MIPLFLRSTAFFTGSLFLLGVRFFYGHKHTLLECSLSNFDIFFCRKLKGGLERCPGNRERKWLFFVSCLNAMFLSIRCKNFHHSCKLWLLSFDFIKKNEQFSLFRLANLSSENKTRFFFGIRFLENCRKDCSHNLPN